MNGPESNRKILLVDDNPAIHEDFKKILVEPRDPSRDSLADAKAMLFGQPAPTTPRLAFEIDSALQGAEALDMVQQAHAEGRPYAMAFVDIRMPPGWDGIETIRRIWAAHPDLQAVICTAYSDYSWEQMIGALGHSENVVILKKPFDNIEVLQLAHALTRKWNLTHQVNERTRQLQLSEERFSKAFRSNPLPMAIQSLHDGGFIDANDSFLRLSGYAAAELVGRTPEALDLWRGQDTHAEAVASVRRHEAVRGRAARLHTRAGGTREILLHVELFEVRDEPCLLTLAEDVTERLNLENQLRHSQKIEAVGQLAAGVAHDFNNFLTIVQGHVSLVLGRGPLDEASNRSLQQALNASERAGNLTRQLLAFSRKQVIERRPLSISVLFDQLNDMLQRLIGDQISIQFSNPSRLPCLHADRCNLEQVLINLAVNARDAMPHGGTLSISASEVHRAAGDAGHPDALSGHFICLTVTDTGCGMDENTRGKIFEPFFTTKEVGKGTGMGLATVYGIVKQHQGWIELDSEPDRGTTFRLFIPASVELDARPGADTPSNSLAAIRADETILVVEDEELLLQFVQTVLEGIGLRVLTAPNAEQALRVWSEHSAEISLMLTDIVMPGGTNGTQLAARLTAEKPGLRVIYSTGYSLDLLRNGGDLPPGALLLQKPYQVKVLLEAIQRCLREHRPGEGLVNNRWTPALPA